MWMIDHIERYRQVRFIYGNPFDDVKALRMQTAEETVTGFLQYFRCDETRYIAAWIFGFVTQDSPEGCPRRPDGGGIACLSGHGDSPEPLTCIRDQEEGRVRP